jgi:hypothetical protein
MLLVANRANARGIGRGRMVENASIRSAAIFATTNKSSSIWDPMGSTLVQQGARLTFGRGRVG